MKTDIVKGFKDFSGEEAEKRAMGAVLVDSSDGASLGKRVDLYEWQTTKQCFLWPRSRLRASILLDPGRGFPPASIPVSD